MQQTNQPTVQSRSWLRAVLKWLLLACLIFSGVVGAAYWLIHTTIVPRVDDWRARIEVKLSDSLGLPVHIGGIEGDSQNGTTHLRVKGIRIDGADGGPALSIPQVDLRFSLASLWQLELADVQITAPVVQAARQASGAWVIAGLPYTAATTTEPPRWLNWLLAQPRIAVSGGTLALRDGQGEPQQWLFTAIDATFANNGRNHALQLEVTPPSDLGARMTSSARMRGGYFSSSLTDFADWEGDVETQIPSVRLEALRALLSRFIPADRWPTHGALNLPSNWVRGGEGSWRAQLAVGRGVRIQSIRNEIALTDLDVQLGADLAPLQLQRLAGQLDWSETDTDWTLRTQGLAFETRDGLRWPGGNAQLDWQASDGNQPGKGRLTGTYLDLKLLGELGNRLPLGPTALGALRTYAPQGLVREASVAWTGDLAAPLAFKTNGQASGVSWLAASPEGDAPLGRPGVDGLDVTWTGDQLGGRLQLQMAAGRWTLPGLWADPVLGVDSLAADMQWTAPQAPANEWTVRTDALTLTTGGSRLDGAVLWRSGPDPAGRLTLTLNADHVDLNGLPRYFPLTLKDAGVRDYLATHLLAGRANDVRVAFDGALDAFPFASREEGHLDIRADITQATFDVGRQLGPELAWPALTQLAGQFEMRDNAIRFTKATGRLRDAPAIVLTDGSFEIPQISGQKPMTVVLDARGPFSAWLSQLNKSPLAAKTQGYMRDWQGDGEATLRLELAVPLATSAVEPVGVRGGVSLSKVGLRPFPSLPPLQDLSTRIAFTDQSITVSNASATWLGGPMTGEGTWRLSPTGESMLQAQVRGSLRAESIARTPALGRLALAARKARGEARFVASVRQTPESGFELKLNAPLTEMAIDLPAPLNKLSGTPWDLQAVLQTAPPSALPTGMVRGQEFGLHIGPVGAPLLRARVQRAYAAATPDVRPISLALREPDVVRGAYVFGSADAVPVTLPESGVAADIRMPAFNADAWMAVFEPTTPPVRVGVALPARPVTTSGGVNAASMLAAFEAYLPTTIVGAADLVTVSGRRFHQVVLGGSRAGPLWRANVLAEELNGYVQYNFGQQGAQDKLYARLAMLNLAEAQTNDVVDLLSNQPKAMPALDVAVDQLTLSGRDLGRFQLQASNHLARQEGGKVANEWQIEVLRLDMAEASFQATGQWAPVARKAKLPAETAARRTYLDVDLTVRDGGALLTRFGMPGVLRAGSGSLSGQLAWLGAPTRFHTPSLSGALNVDMQKGQFLKADPGLSKLLGVLSLQSLPRRLTLDFSDVFFQGFSFDGVRGSATIRDGVLTTNNLTMQGLGALVLMEGSADMKAETQDLNVVVVPKVDNGTLALLAAAANPVVGVVTYFANEFLDGLINRVTVKGFHVTGSWADPDVADVKVDDAMKQKIPASTPK